MSTMTGSSFTAAAAPSSAPEIPRRACTQACSAATSSAMPTTSTCALSPISITTKGHGPVMLSSIAIYNRQAGLTYNSVGYPGAQASLVNKFSTKLLANDLIRINPQIVVLSFGTNEASNEGLDIAKYTEGYERIVNKIKTTLPAAQIVVIGPPEVVSPVVPPETATLVTVPKVAGRPNQPFAPLALVP